MSYAVRQGVHFAFHDDRVSARVIASFQAGAKREQYVRKLLGGGRLTPGRRRKMQERLDEICRRGYDCGPSDTVLRFVQVNSLSILTRIDLA